MSTLPQSSLALMEELYEDGPYGLLFLDGRGQLVHVNRTLLSWTGYSEAELQKSSPYSLLLTVPGALLFQTHCIPLLRLRGFISEISLDLRCKDGRQMPVLLAANVKKDETGTESLVRVLFVSAPNRREYERELLRARTQAEDAASKLRRMSEEAQRKVAEQEVLLQSVARMTSGDLDTPVGVDSQSSLFPLASALDRMRKDILDQICKLKDHAAEVQQLNKELRRQIEQRSRLLVASMESGLASGMDAEKEEYSTDIQPILARGTLLAERYVIGDILGQGGMGTVYEVTRAADGRPFAAKVLGDKPSYRAMARFAREAQLLARINHPNLIDIIDVDITEDRVAYIIMELVRGKSLAELRHRYGERDFMLWILLQTAEALTAVHSAGAVHRDLKPGNILVANRDDGTVMVKLADFGISRLLDSVADTPNTSAQAAREMASLAARMDAEHRTRGALGQASTWLGQLQSAVTEELSHQSVPPPQTVDPPMVFITPRELGPTTDGDSTRSKGRRRRLSEELTQAGAILGTPLYMAPELRSGAQLALPSSDVFGFGMVAYEVLTGTLPFEQPPLLWADLGITSPTVIPLQKRCLGLHPLLAQTLDACLSIDPRLRPTAAELVQVLAGSLAPAARPIVAQLG